MTAHGVQEEGEDTRVMDKGKGRNSNKQQKRERGTVGKQSGAA